MIAGKNDFIDSIKKKKIAFTIEEAFNTPKVLNDVQNKYFVIESVAELKKCLEDYTKKQIENNGKAAIIPEGFDTTEEIDEFRRGISISLN